MTLEDRIYGQALAMTGELSQTQDVLLRLLSRAAAKELQTRLRPGIRVEGCPEAMEAAGSLLAYAAFLESDSSPQRFTAGELTVQGGDRSAAVACLRAQAEGIAAPYVRSGVFLGV